MHFVNDQSSYPVPICRQPKNLPGCNLLCLLSCNAPPGLCGLWILDGEAAHPLDDSLGGGDGLQVSEAAAGALWPLLLDQHMPDLACCRRDPMIDAPIDDQSAPDAPSQADIQRDQFAFPAAILHCAESAVLNLCQSRCICIVVYYTRSFKSCGHIVLKGEILPFVGVMEAAHDALAGIDQAADGHAHAQDAPVLQAFGGCYLCDHLIEQVQHAPGIWHIIQEIG